MLFQNDTQVLVDVNRVFVLPGESKEVKIAKNEAIEPFQLLVTSSLGSCNINNFSGKITITNCGSLIAETTKYTDNTGLPLIRFTKKE